MAQAILPYLRAFLVGGLFCVIAQILIDKTKLTPARILVTYVVAGVILGGLGLYQPIVDFAGAGATTPLTGALKATAGGIAAALVFGYLACLIFHGKPKG